MGDAKGTIVYIGGFEMPDKNAAAHRVVNNAKILKKMGYHIVFCGIANDIEVVSEKSYDIGGFDSWPSVYPKTGGEWIKWLIDFKHIEKVISAYSNVKYAIAYNMHSIPLTKLIKYCRKNNIKLIADVTEWYENKFSIHPIKLIKCIDTTIVMRVLQKKVDGMIAISTYLERYYRKHVSRIVVIPPLIDIDDDKWKQDVERNSNGIEFVYSGSPGIGKDQIGKIVDSFYCLNTSEKYCFKVFGITREQFLEKNSSQEKQLESLGDRIKFFGRVTHRESIAALLRANYCIFIREKSRKNMAGFPTKFVECYTSGINIIANDISDIAQYFPNEKENIILKDSSSEGIMCALKYVFELAKKQDMSFEKGERVYLNRFDYREWEDKFDLLIE